MSEIKNPDIRKLLYRFVPERTNKNALFVKTFGKNFSSKKIIENVLTVYSNVPSPINGAAAFHRGADKSITFCCSLNDTDNKLTSEQFLKDKELQKIAVHESIHAILRRTKKECKKYNISSGTGLLEIFYNGNSEIGRGLNEGYTEWLCEKLGFEVVGYPELTNFVRLIEAAIGTEKTMQLGKGGTQSNFPQLLNLTQDETNYLLGLSDQVYIVGDHIKTQRRLASLLKVKANIDLLDENKKQLIKNDYDKYLNLINEYMQNPLFQNYVKEKGLEKTEETLIKYLNEESIPNLQEQKKEAIISFESFVLDKYYIKDLQQVFRSSELSDENLEKLYKINSLLNTDLDNLPDSIKNMKPPMTCIVFKEEGKKAIERYIKQSVENDAKEYRSGKFNIRDFINKHKFYYKLHPNLSNTLLREFANHITSAEFAEFKHQFLSLLRFAFRNADNEDLIKKIAEASIYKLKSQDSEKNIESILVYDNENFLDKYFSKGTVFRGVAEEYEFDFTGDFMYKNEYKEAMANFLKLQKRVFASNPNARIHIASRDIIVQDGDNIEFYEIHKGKLVPMMVEKQMDLQFHYEEKQQSEEQTQTALVPVRNSRLDNILNFFRRKINDRKNKGKPDIPNYKNEETGKIEFEVSTNQMDKYKVKDLPEISVTESSRELESKELKNEIYVKKGEKENEF